MIQLILKMCDKHIKDTEAAECADTNPHPTPYLIYSYMHRLC